MNLQTGIRFLKGVGEKRAAVLQKLGIATIGDLITHTPRAYEDWQTIAPIAQAAAGVPVCVRATVDEPPKKHRIRSGLTLYKTQVSDDTGSLGITIFNNVYQAEKLRQGDALLFYGRIAENFFVREMSAPQFAPLSEARLHPIYPLTEGISSRALERLISIALEQVSAHIKEILPDDLLAEYDLMGRAEALRAIHQPRDMDEALRARRRLAFNELLTLQLGFALLRQGRADETAAALPAEAAEEFLSLLPFIPTAAQVRAVREAASEMASPQPMRRLLQGDVGSGKTAVAAALLMQAVRGGTQGAIMAPTELLARQHFETLHALFAPCKLPPDSLALLVGSTGAKEKKRIKEGLAAGTIPLVVGTHALLERDVAFAQLGLAVVDEQHRFGVEQRNALTSAQEKAALPHLLVMSATPIPRSLAMIIYGDLDISVLDELPPGRTPVETYCVPSALHTRAYGYVRKHLDAGRQGYIVCPRVEDDDAGELAAVTQLYDSLSSGVFAGYRLGLLHGKLGSRQKEAVMQGFAEGKIQLLISTTVVEVGVDVPNAVIMVIENAERFGLSQLHQLRGRVGRGKEKSTCILISDAENEDAQARFEIMKQTNDGFLIAKKDLELRGPGDFFGARQHGLPVLRLADIAADAELLAQSRAAASELLRRDPNLSDPAHYNIKKLCEKLFSG